MQSAHSSTKGHSLWCAFRQSSTFVTNGYARVKWDHMWEEIHKCTFPPSWIFWIPKLCHGYALTRTNQLRSMTVVGRMVFCLHCCVDVALFTRGKFYRFRLTPDNIPGKTYLDAHPYHIPGAAALKSPLHVFRYQPRPIPKNLWRPISPQRMKPHNVVRCFTATLSGVKHTVVCVTNRQSSP